MTHETLSESKDSKVKEALPNVIKKFTYKEFLIQEISIPGYEKIYQIENEKTKLRSIIAMHSSKLGAPLGGIRIYPYATWHDALKDVLRLSQGMTYKAAVAGVGLGGGKAVILADPSKDKTPELLQSFGEVVDWLEGKYICAEDVGCSLEDVFEVRKKTKYVVGLPHQKSSGNPAIFTAWGTFRGIAACLKRKFGQESFEGKTIALQGLGSVGMLLAEHFFWAGAKLIVADIDSQKVQTAITRFHAISVPCEEIFSVECDVFCPSAMGAIVNDDTINKFRCKIIAGCANNQLLRESHADELKNKNILYAPDFVINAGGLLNVASELDTEGYNPLVPRKKVSNIFETLTGIFDISEKNNISTHKAAIMLAESCLRLSLGKRRDPLCFHHDAT